MQSYSSDLQHPTHTRVSRPIAIVGFVFGLILSLSVLSGDDAGRVNVLYLLLVYLVIPLLGALISIISLLKGKGLNVARLLSALPIWSNTQKSELLTLRQQNIDKQWFFLQSQAAALAYALASLLTLLVLLLATDINFVWRSTLLDPEQLLPSLSAIALPWWFWESAQPSIELLQITQDSRLTSNYVDPSSFGNWWTFILATQIIYSFLLRGILFILATIVIKKRPKASSHQHIYQAKKAKPVEVQTPALASITHALPNNYALCNWAAFDDDIIQGLVSKADRVLSKGPVVVDIDNATFDEQLILVKAWEPPMGELADYMQTGKGLLYPINLSQNKAVKPEPKHLQEWQRFTAELPNWIVYLPQQWDANNDK